MAISVDISLLKGSLKIKKSFNCLSPCYVVVFLSVLAMRTFLRPITNCHYNFRLERCRLSQYDRNPYSSHSIKILEFKNRFLIDYFLQSNESGKWEILKRINQIELLLFSEFRSARTGSFLRSVCQRHLIRFWTVYIEQNLY